MKNNSAALLGFRLRGDLRHRLTNRNSLRIDLQRDERRLVGFHGRGECGSELGCLRHVDGVSAEALREDGKGGISQRGARNATWI